MLGLSFEEAAKELSYFHFREPVHMPNLLLLDRAKQDKAIDFLDTIETDYPKGKFIIN